MYERLMGSGRIMPADAACKDYPAWGNLVYV